ncbi:hypothetical protein BLS_009431 [Venturia inaequalis]|uniref:MARVEL domain-containing protein n=1 Tax=Venturia inaequalis TaxID=5025 RepID=A0A8H3YMS1_VENIN|nr:hypothetical protein BLS_009431 [Venturia inaequalis]
MSRAQTYRQNAPLGKPGHIIKGIARGTQILFGGLIAILLGVTLGKAWHYTTGWHHLWGFSCVIASASTFTAMALCSNTIQSYCYFFADGFFLTMWAIVAGIFGSVYFPFPKQELPLNKGTTGPSLTTMRAVSVLNLMVMMAWVCTFALSIWHFMKVKKSVKSVVFLADARRLGISTGYDGYNGGYEPKVGGRTGLDWKQSVLRWKLVSKM